jgi:SanA protein
MKTFKKILKIFLLLSVLGILFIFFANYTIQNSSKEFLYEDAHKIPNCKTAIVLGTSKSLSNGNPNLYFKYRIEAAAELFKTGKIQNIIVSGDNSVKGYTETEDMKNDLIALGVPAEKIFEDFAGFRTLDSVVRAKEIFGQTEVIFVSQKFHNERAIFLAEKFGIKAYGFNAKDVKKYFGFKTKIREYFARSKVFVDFLFGVEPKFGGEKIEIK